MSSQPPDHRGSNPRAATQVRTPHVSNDSHQNQQPGNKPKDRSKQPASAETPSHPGPQDERSGSGILGQIFSGLMSLAPPVEGATPERKHRELVEEVSQMRRREQELRERLADKDQKLKEKDQKLREKDQKLREKDNRLREKEAELEELKKTFRMYNDCSEVDLGEMVDNINTKIQSLTINTAMGWRQALGEASDNAGVSREVGDEGVDKIKSLIGTQFADALSAAVGTPGQYEFAVGTLLPLAWQACITATVAKVLSSFSAGLAGIGDDAILKKIAGGVMMGEAQPAYGRWRFVTHQYLRRLLSNDEQAAIQAYVDEALATCRIACQLAIRKGCPSDQDFANAFQTQLCSIVDDAFRLLTMIQERMITANFEPYVPRNGEPFDTRSMVMDREDKIFPNDRVACTTGLGLLWWRKEGRERTSTMSPKSIFKEAGVLTEGNLQDLVAMMGQL